MKDIFKNNPSVLRQKPTCLKLSHKSCIFTYFSSIMLSVEKVKKTEKNKTEAVMNLRH